MSGFVNILEIFQEHTKTIASLEKLIPEINTLADKMVYSLQNKGTIFWIGNGGSASDAQHMAAELIGRFKKERRALSSLALTTDSSVLTALSNDYDFNIVFSRQLEGLCQPQDIVIGLSTSGNSRNIIQGIQTAKKIGAYTAALTGRTGGELKSVSDLCLSVSSDVTARIQEAHTLICHVLCELVENKF